MATGYFYSISPISLASATLFEVRFYRLPVDRWDDTHSKLNFTLMLSFIIILRTHPGRTTIEE